jgi:hypothetical protein
MKSTVKNIISIAKESEQVRYLFKSENRKILLIAFLILYIGQFCLGKAITYELNQFYDIMDIHNVSYFTTLVISSILAKALLFLHRH